MFACRYVPLELSRKLLDALIIGLMTHTDQIELQLGLLYGLRLIHFILLIVVSPFADKIENLVAFLVN